VGWEEGDVLRRWEEGVKRGLAERGFLGRGEMERVTAMALVESEQQTMVPLVSARASTPMNLMWGTSNVPVSSMKADEHRRKAIVKLSCDAGRFLCEYALFESLSRRWLDAHRTHKGEDDGQRGGKEIDTSSSPLPSSSATPESGDSWSTPGLSSADDLAQERLGKVAFLHVPGWTGVEDINRGVMVAEEAIRALVGSWEDGYRRNGRVEAMAYTQQHSEEKGRVAATWRA